MYPTWLAGIPQYITALFQINIMVSHNLQKQEKTNIALKTQLHRTNDKFSLIYADLAAFFKLYGNL